MELRCHLLGPSVHDIRPASWNCSLKRTAFRNDPPGGRRPRRPRTCGSGAIAVVADDEGITVALIDYASFDPETVESVSSGVDISSDAMTIHCAVRLEVPADSCPWIVALHAEIVVSALLGKGLLPAFALVSGHKQFQEKSPVGPVSHLSSHEQIGRPLAAFQTLRHRVADHETAAQERQRHH